MPAARWGVRMVGRSLFDLAHRGLREMDLSGRMQSRPGVGDILLVELEDGRDFRVRVRRLREWNAERTPVFREAFDETPL